MRDAVIVEAVRTPVGKGRPTGALAEVHPVDLLAHSLSALIERTGIDPALVDDVIGGVVSQVGEQGGNITRRAALAAGFPDTVPAISIDRQCGSSQQAVHFAAQGVISGAYDIAIAAGVESMSRIPIGSSVAGANDINGVALAERYPDGLVDQGYSAELIASRWGITREEMDSFAITSHEKADAATKAGAFDAEIAPVAGLTHDEGIRPGGTLEKLATLQPAFYNEEMAERFPQIDWNVTAASASQISDGSAAVMVTTSEMAEKLGLTPLARVHSFAVAGADPLYMLTAVIPATAQVLKRAGLSIDDIDLFEVSEAFAPVVLAWAKETGADLTKVNKRGGAIALGHPLGASGARLMTTLVHTLKDTGARYGLQTMCEGGGMANATILERL
ncbi:acetyl-CoA C-acyltransferase [Leucobacter komagatae]|uniref:Acetyl-CoA acetyltransferase n=1 Tax=Leucobacter komagatae TaxID=55969 RepID=A0A0D0H7T0_9MICO|nr:acetyl-CoA C-acyltransferase [Leucobacter komagatae]KIP53280.1 acetyl-CoA acetyltransferase [Leucobacter komagatae]